MPKPKKTRIIRKPQKAAIRLGRTKKEIDRLLAERLGATAERQAEIDRVLWKIMHRKHSRPAEKQLRLPFSQK